TRSSVLVLGAGVSHQNSNSADTERELWRLRRLKAISIRIQSLIPFQIPAAGRDLSIMLNPLLTSRSDLLSKIFAPFSSSAPESQHAEAARGIQEKMKLMVDLCKQMAMEAPSIVKCDRPGKTPSEEFVKLDKEDSPALGTSVVGGSAFGWNFVTYISSKAEYYGRTKESFRASIQKSEG
ncbi:hypothetical protein V2J09_005102, partial [Rumex salicifolius]